MYLVCCWDEVGYLLVVGLVGLGVVGGADCGWFRMVDGGGCVCMWLLVVGWLGVARGAPETFWRVWRFCFALRHRCGPAVAPLWIWVGTAVSRLWPGCGPTVARLWPDSGTGVIPQWLWVGCAVALGWLRSGPAVAPVWPRSGPTVAPVWRNDIELSLLRFSKSTKLHKMGGRVIRGVSVAA